MLRSSCANALDRGAAYFGKAGFDVKDVIDRLLEQEGQSNTADAYLRTLVPNMNRERFNYLDHSDREYSSLGNNKDAQFYLSIVKTMKALSTIRSVIGEISDCDLNTNNIPDDVDATACMLEKAGNVSANSTGTCNVANYSTSSVLTFANDTTTNYLGMTVNVSSSPQQGCPVSYKKLYYEDASGSYMPATTAGFCKTDGTQCNEQEPGCWPCPMSEQRDLLQTVEENLNSAVDLLANLLGNNNPDLRRSIEELREEVCGQDGNCTADEIKDYIIQIRI